MFQLNENYQKLPGSYLFSTIAKKVAAFTEAHPDKQIIRLGIGDVTQPIAPAIIEAMHKAVDEMGKAETFHGYAPDLGYGFLRKAIAEHDYRARGCDIAEDDYLKSVCSQFPDLFRDVEEAYRILYGNYYEEADFPKRPLSKFTRDIYEDSVGGGQ